MNHTTVDYSARIVIASDIIMMKDVNRIGGWGRQLKKDSRQQRDDSNPANAVHA